MTISTTSSISIRPLLDWSEYHAAEVLQKVVWQMPDWRDVVPAELLITAQRGGGFVLGAFDSASDGRLVGLAFSFVGIDEGPHGSVFKQCSHLLAVLPEYQSRKIGVQLKLKQRELTLAQGIPLMTWTYDPLLFLNARLNLARLGAVARRYIPNAYGDMSDGLNAGLSSDRFQVEWWLNSSRAVRGAAGEPPHTDWAALVRAGAREVFDIAWDGPFPSIQAVHALGGDSLCVEIPSDLAALKAHAPDLAREWRSRTRDVFERAFGAGYTAQDLVMTQGEPRRAAYVLTRTPVDTGGLR